MSASSVNGLDNLLLTKDADAEGMVKHTPGRPEKAHSVTHVVLRLSMRYNILPYVVDSRTPIVGQHLRLP